MIFRHKIFSYYPWLKRFLIFPIGLIAIFGVAVTLTLVVLSPPSVSQSSSNDEIYKQLGLFGDVFQRVREEYVEEISAPELIESAINGMLGALDPHSSFLNEEDFKGMQRRTRGEFGGLGIEITMEDGLVKVISPIDETPAAQAGIKSGDFIVKIDDEDIFGLTLTDAVELMRGPVGSDVEITISRMGEEPFIVNITRAIIKVQSVRHESYDTVGYIRLTTFSAQTTPGLKKAISTLKDEHGTALEGIILDLRNNAGGLLSEAVAVADAFLDKGEIVSTRGRRESETARYYATTGDEFDGLPLVVLINSGSASASEIVAGALKDHRRALIMGTRSFGKGSVQSIIPISGNGAMRLTTARYYTPSGISIQSTGIEPDIIVELAVVQDIETNGVRREENLRGALDTAESDQNEILEGDDETIEQINIEDYQLARAIDLVRGINVFNTTLE